MILGKCNVGEIASRQCEVSKFYVGKAGIGKMGEYVIGLLFPNIIISYFYTCHKNQSYPDYQYTKKSR